MRPTKLSSKVFLELPPVLAHYVDAERNLWVDGNPKRGRLSLLNRSGHFTDLEARAVERRHLIRLLGVDRLRALTYRVGFEQGRRDATRHLQTFGDNARLALQAALVFGQLQGRFVAEPATFEFDLEKRTLYREIALHSCAEAVVHAMSFGDRDRCVCWETAGYLSGHVSEILGRRVHTLEVACLCHGDESCRFVSKLDSEWGDEAAWVRAALDAPTVDDELRRKDELVEAAQRAARRAQAALNDIERRMRSDLLIETIVADSPVMAPVIRRAQHLMAGKAPVLITGEAGTGKETLARAIHFGGGRKNRPFVAVDCIGMTNALLTQELLGYEKGAIPGAIQDYKGAVARSSGGTLYLNEATRLSYEQQGLLLKMLEEGAVTPLGAEKPVKVDLRVIAAIRTNPLDAVSTGALREDLFYVLAVGRIDLPPLRERESDILRLAELFLKEFRGRHGREGVTMSRDFIDVILHSAWPGNVRQLRNVIEHAVILAHDRELTPADLPEEVLASRWTKQPQDLTEAVIRATLKRTNNNRSRAADLLGVGRTTLWRAMKRLDIA